MRVLFRLDNDYFRVILMSLIAIVYKGSVLFLMLTDFSCLTFCSSTNV